MRTARIGELFCRQSRIRTAFFDLGLVCHSPICSSKLCTEGTALTTSRSMLKPLNCSRAWWPFCTNHFHFLFSPACSWSRKKMWLQEVWYARTTEQPQSRPSQLFSRDHFVNLESFMGLLKKHKKTWEKREPSVLAVCISVQRSDTVKVDLQCGPQTLLSTDCQSTGRMRKRVGFLKWTNTCFCKAEVTEHRFTPRLGSWNRSELKDKLAGC